MAIDPQNLAGTATLTFDDEFNSLNLRNGGAGLWSTNYWWGQPNGVTLTNNGEQQWYIDANYAPTQSVKPWSVSNGVLDITAQNAAPDIQQQINGYKYTSGMLTTHDSFSQTYGYFEMKAELPDGQGLWPAFWLLPESGAWPPEIDIMEQLGNNPNVYYTAAHTQQTGAHTSKGGVVDTPNLTTGFHTYGLDWEADKLTYYFDGKPAWQTDTPADMHDPMYMLVNLAVGGSWPGDPVADPNYSETMHVDYVRAYAARPDGAATPATPVVEAPVAPAPADPVIAAPAEPTPSAPAPAQETPVIEAPVLATPSTETPAAETPAASAPAAQELAAAPEAAATPAESAPAADKPQAQEAPAPITESAPATVANEAFNFDAIKPLAPAASTPAAPTQQAADLQRAVDAASTDAFRDGHHHQTTEHHAFQDYMPELASLWTHQGHACGASHHWSV